MKQNDVVCKIGVLRDVFFGIDSHNFMTIWLEIEGDSWGCSYGGVPLDLVNPGTNKRVSRLYAIPMLRDLLCKFKSNQLDNLKERKVECEMVRGEYGARVITRIRLAGEEGEGNQHEWFSFADYDYKPETLEAV